MSGKKERPAHKAPGAKATSVKTSGGKTPDVETPSAKTAGGKAAGAKPPKVKASDAKAAGGKASGTKPPKVKVSDAKASSAKAAGGKASGAKPPKVKAPSVKASGAKAAGGKTSGAKAPKADAKAPGFKAQVAALPVQGRDADLRVLLVTSRETRRWIIPKGWPEKGMKDYDAAAREALEEAGLTGRISRRPIGHYRYFKRTLDSFQPCSVAVYRLDVEGEQPTWSEQGQRQRAWFSPDVAALLVDEPELKLLLLELADGGKA